MDKAHLMALHRAQFPANARRSISREYYEWKIYKNPVMAGYIYLEVKNGRVVGSSTLMPRRIAILDEIVLGAEWGDSFTPPEYRRQGINARALSACKDYAILHGMDLIYGPPNEANYGIHLKLGCKPCEHIRWAFLKKSLNPVRLASKLCAKIILGKQAQKSFHQLAYLSGRIMTRSRSLQSLQNSNQKEFNVVKIDSFKNEVDPLWGKPRYSFFVYRDKEYLNWRYFDNPDKFLVLAAVKGQDCLGYIVLKMSNDKRTGILCDFATIDDRSDVFVSLVSESERVLKQKGADRITLRCIVGSPYYHDLNSLGYYDPGQDSYSRVVIYAKTEMGKRVLENHGKWHFTFGDTDEV